MSSSTENIFFNVPQEVEAQQRRTTEPFPAAHNCSLAFFIISIRITLVTVLSNPYFSFSFSFLKIRSRLDGHTGRESSQILWLKWWYRKFHSAESFSPHREEDSESLPRRLNTDMTMLSHLREQARDENRLQPSFFQQRSCIDSIR